MFINMEETKTHEHTHSEEAEKVVSVEEPDKKMIMGILAYLGPLLIISYLFAKDDTFVRYHIRQGLVLLVAMGITWFVSMTPFMIVLFPFVMIVNLALLVLAIIGIVNVVGKKEKPLPLVGRFSSLFPL